ncbi:hypothetical protein D3M96_05395 [Alcaligenes aquatilis]|uniref:Uncharacterized protein n=1 Tax=Alcaligenes aquatilis TaxID=323284 RepID=A0A3G2HSB0_9BURK|nr:hypothetical protein D3M96_05395 [Alcaligenes aquatilis]
MRNVGVYAIRLVDLRIQISGRGSENGAAQFLIDGDGWDGRVLTVSVRRWPIVQEIAPPPMP